MADDSNKVGQIHVDVVANTAPFDAAMAKVKATGGAVAGTPAAGTAAASAAPIAAAQVAAGQAATVAGAQQEAAAVKATTANNGLLRTLGQVKSAFARMLIPVAVALGIVKIITYLDDMRAAALRANDALKSIGQEFREGVNQRISASKAAAADAEKGIGGTAAKELEIANRKKAALIKIEEEKAKRIAEIEGQSGFARLFDPDKKGTETNAEYVARKKVEAERTAQDQINTIEKDAASETTNVREEAAAAEAKSKADKLKAATDAAKASEKELRKASLEGDELAKDNVLDQIDEATAKKAAAASQEEAAAYDNQIESLTSLYNEIERKQEEAAKAKKELADRDDAERKQHEEEDKNRRVQHERDVARASQQALTDFNNQARTSLNELLNTNGILTGMDKLASILLAIKSSQGAV